MRQFDFQDSRGREVSSWLWGTCRRPPLFRVHSEWMRWRKRTENAWAAHQVQTENLASYLPDAVAANES